MYASVDLAWHVSNTHARVVLWTLYIAITWLNTTWQSTRSHLRWQCARCSWRHMKYMYYNLLHTGDVSATSRHSCQICRNHSFNHVTKYHVEANTHPSWRPMRQVFVTSRCQICRHHSIPLCRNVLDMLWQDALASVRCWTQRNNSHWEYLEILRNLTWSSEAGNLWPDKLPLSMWG